MVPQLFLFADRNLEAPGSNLGLKTGCPDWGFLSSSVPSGNAGIVP
jgi:hypothetical protein